MERYDIAIIGTGPAGLSAAVTATVRNTAPPAMHLLSEEERPSSSVMTKKQNRRLIS